jgi:SAM-dependent methyltransferase
VKSVRDHYREHLAPIYSWMAGGIEAALARGEAELDSLHLQPKRSGLAVDLGAGFGMHAIPLAKRGFTVVAVDSSTALLGELQAHAAELPIKGVAEDLLSFMDGLTERPEVILCMGDTLTHLPDKEAIGRLFTKAATLLAPDAAFVLSFRDYTTPLVGESRFIPVRSDADRILTCFIEYAAEHIEVYDLLQERDGSRWNQRVSSYRKLRLAPEWVAATLEKAGLRTRQGAGLSGMTRLVAYG